MRKLRLCVTVVGLLGLTSTVSSSGSGAGAPGLGPQRSSSPLPLVFEVNRGQVPDPVRFVARRPGHALLLTPEEARLIVDAPPDRTREIRMAFEGARPLARMEGLDRLRGKAHYLVGHDPRGWRTDIPLFARVAYRELYHSVDVVVRGGEGDVLEFDFEVAPGGDPQAIALRFEGARRVEIGGAGELRIVTEEGVLIQKRPYAYQEVDGRTRPVASRFVQRRPDLVGFEMGEYDRDRPLVIDPPLAYSTFIGGDGTDRVNAVAVDAQGKAYVAGETTSMAGPDALDFPTKDPLPGGDQLGSYPLPPPDPRPYPSVRLQDAFVGKLDTTLSGPDSLVYMTFFGGGLGNDRAFALAVDGSGQAHIGGLTSSTDLPLVNPLQSCKDGGGNFVCSIPLNLSFVARLSASGSALEYSSYINGNGVDEVLALAVGPQGRLYVGGRTESPPSTSPPGNVGYFPVTADALQPTNRGIFDAFLMVLDLSSADPVQQLVYSTLFGGCSNDEVHDLAVDSQGRVALAGTTQACSNASFKLPLVNAFQSAYKGGLSDAFVARIDPAIPGPFDPANPGASGLVFSTLLGGKDDEDDLRRSGLALDAAGNIHVAGTTSSADFPTTPGGAQRCGGMSASAAATYPCDPATGQYAGALPPNGVVIDGYLATFSPSGQLLHSTFVGGAGQDSIGDVSVGEGGLVHVAGATNSAGLGSTCAPQPALALGRDAYLATLKLSPAAGGFSSERVFFTYLGGGSDDFATSVAYDGLTESTFVGGYAVYNTSSKLFPTTANALQPTQPGSSSLPFENGFLSQVVKPAACAPDLVLRKFGSPEPADAGCGLTYTIEVQNLGVMAASQVVVTDPLPAGTALVSASSSVGTCAGATTVTCQLGTVSPGDAALITLETQIDVAFSPTQPPLVNTATVGSLEADANAADNGATWTTHVAPPGDSDGVPNCLDACPFDSGKTDPGVCGCGVPDIDSDGDGTADCLDLCPADPGKTAPGACGCGVPDIDSDGDGVLDCNEPPNGPPAVQLTGATSLSAGTTATYDFVVADPDGGAFTAAAGYPSCGAAGQLIAGSLTQSGNEGSFQCLFPNGPATSTVAMQVVDAAGAASNVATVDVTVAAPVAPSNWLMIGNGKLAGELHHFKLFCNPAVAGNSLKVKWAGHVFQLTQVNAAACADDPGISSGNPPVPFDVHTGGGAGTLDGVAGASISWTFTDAGEPGSVDVASLQVKDAQGVVILDVSGPLAPGNHQAQMQ